MSFILSNSSPSRVGGTSVDVPASTFYKTAFEQGLSDMAFTSLWRMGDLAEARAVDDVVNPMVFKEDANAFMKEKGLDISFDKDVTMDEMNLLADRAEAQRDRQLILSAGNEEGGWGSFRTYGQIGTQFLGSILSPVDLPLMFVPIVGTSTKGGMLARGLVTQETLAAKGLAFRGYTASIIEGAVGQAITEVPLLISNTQSQLDYDGQDFITNVALGGAFGAAVNTIRLGVIGSKNLFKTLSPQTKETMGTAAMSDFIEGRPIDPARYINLDDEVTATRSVGDFSEKADIRDAEFKERYSKLSPNEKSIFEFNQGNKLVDDKGLPIVVYHGRTWTGDKFDASKMGDNTRASSAKEGFFFAGNLKTSQYYILRSQYQNNLEISAKFDELEELSRKIEESPENADALIKARFQEIQDDLQNTLGIKDVFREGGNVSAFILSAKNPKILDFEGRFHRPQTYKDAIAAAKAEGHDAVVIRNTFDGGPLDDIYVVFDNKSIKSAYEYRFARTAEEKLRANKESIKQFEKAEKDAEDRKVLTHKREIESGNTIPVEKQVFVRDTPTDDDVARLQQEIDELQEMMGLTEVEMRQMIGTVNSKSPDYEINIPQRMWERYLPKSEGKTWTADEFAGAILNLVNPEVSRIIEELFELDPSLKTMKVKFKPELKELGANGEYDARLDLVYMGPEAPVSTLAHELVHGSAVRRWREDLEKVKGNQYIPIRRGRRYLDDLEDYAKATENENLAGLVRSYIDAVNYHAKNRDVNILDHLNEPDFRKFASNVSEPHYGLLNFDEFIAEALTNRPFQLYLNEIKGRGDRSVFSYFVEAIKNIFRISDKGPSILDDVLFDFSGMVSKNADRAKADYLDKFSRFTDDQLKMKKATNFDINKNVLAQTSTCILNGL